MSPQDAPTHTDETQPPTRFLRMCDVEQRVGLNQRTIQRLVKAESFPQPVQLPGRVIAFVEAELEDWMQERIDARTRKVEAGDND